MRPGARVAGRSRGDWRSRSPPPLAAATVAGVAVWLALADDRELADSYRETLAVANGEYFDAAPLELPGGEKIGYVYGYQGRASWVLAVVYDGVATGVYELELVTDDGRQRPLRELTVVGGEGSAGARDAGALRRGRPRSACSTATAARSPTPSCASSCPGDPIPLRGIW